MEERQNLEIKGEKQFLSPSLSQTSSGNISICECNFMDGNTKSLGRADVIRVTVFIDDPISGLIEEYGLYLGISMSLQVYRLISANIKEFEIR